MKPINITLSPHDALVLASFHSEFTEDAKRHPECESLLKAMNSYMEQVVNMSDEQYEDAKAEIEVNSLLKRNPGTR